MEKHEILQAIQSLNMSLNKVAKAAGINQSRLWTYLNTERDIHAESYKRLCRYLQSATPNEGNKEAPTA